MNLYKYIIILLIFFVNGCSTIRESAGVTRKNIDEYIVLENPPLVIPPNFNLLPPDQLEERNIDDIESELANEILFGLDNDVTKEKIQLSTMNQILSKTGALDVPSAIREEINSDFSQEIDVKGIFAIDFEREIDVLDAIKESERLRNINFEGGLISEGEVPVKKQIMKKKKKKRFILF